MTRQSSEDDGIQGSMQQQGQTIKNGGNSQSQLHVLEENLNLPFKPSQVGSSIYPQTTASLAGNHLDPPTAAFTISCACA